MKIVDFISFLILIFGGINWLSIALFQYDIVAGLFGTQASIFSRIIYLVVGIATAYTIFKAFKDKGQINILPK
jgi:uncharacterized protein